MKKRSLVYLLPLITLLPLIAQRGGVIFKEDFSTYEPGDALPDWGKNVIAIQNHGKLNYLTSQVPGDHIVEQKIAFPQNFSMEFTWRNPMKTSYLVLESDSGENVRIDFRLSRRNDVYSVNTKYNNTVEKVFSYNRKKNPHTYQLKIIRKNGTFKLFVDDGFLISTTLPDVGQILGFRMVVPEGQLFTRFKVTKIVIPN